MRLIVVLVSFGRKELLAQTVRHLDAQTRPPDEVVVSVPDEDHVEPWLTPRFRLTYVYGAYGCTAQRNAALRAADGRYDAVVFFDDDFLPAPDYLERLCQHLQARADWAVVTGRVIRDGINGCGLSFEEGQQIIEEDCAAGRLDAEKASERPGAYGCNMAMRACDIGQLRFDERLPLYGWQEDTDFSRRVARGRKIMLLDDLRGVHLGLKQGRINGVRFGYSQIANPAYLTRKGSMPLRWAVALMTKNVISNLVRAARPEPYVDRLGRLKGNVIAFRHLLRGRIEPEYILRL
jgi:GT2 family glycosyltransferase